MRLEGLGKLKKKNPITSSGFDPSTFRLVIVPQPTTLINKNNNIIIFIFWDITPSSPVNVKVSE
jgi:hypothetical protein